MADLALRDFGAAGRPLTAGHPLHDSNSVGATMPAGPDTDDRLARFLDGLRAGGASPNTIRAYTTDLGQYTRWLAASGTDLEQVDVKLLRRYAAYLGTMRYAPATAARKLSAVRSAHAWLPFPRSHRARPGRGRPGTEAGAHPSGNALPPRDRAAARAGRWRRSPRAARSCAARAAVLVWSASR